MSATVRIACPGCGVSLRVTLGATARTARCPKCSESVPIPAEGDRCAAGEAETTEAAKPVVPSTEEQKLRPPADAPSDETETTDERVHRPRDSDRSAAWRLVRHGLLIILIAAVGQVVMGFLSSLVFLVSFSLPVQIVTTGLGAVLSLAGVVGVALLGFVPAAYAPRKLLFACLAVISLSVIHGIVIQIQLFHDLSALKVGAVTMSQEDIKKKIDDDAKRFAKLTPEEMQRETAKMLDESKRQLDDLQASQRRSQLWNLPLMVLTSLAGVLLPLYFRQLAESLKERATVTQCEALIKWKLIQVGLSLVPQLLMTPQIVVRVLGPLMILFRGIGILGMLLGLYCLVLEIQIVLSLRNALTDNAAVRRKRKTKRRRSGTRDDE